jgi:hypothetical protein
VGPDSAFVNMLRRVHMVRLSYTRTRWLCKINDLGERQLRREQRERPGLLPGIEDRLTNRCRLCGCIGRNSLACVEPARVPFVLQLVKGFSWWLGLNICPS